jgi:hypothetical protein
MFSSPRPSLGAESAIFFFRLQYGVSGPHHERAVNRGHFFWPLLWPYFTNKIPPVKTHWLGAWPRGERTCVKRGYVGSSPAAIILHFTHGLPVYPFTHTAEPVLAVGVYSHELPPSPPHGQRTNCPMIAPATLDGTARAWRSAHSSIPGVQWLCSPEKDIAFFAWRCF